MLVVKTKVKHYFTLAPILEYMKYSSSRELACAVPLSGTGGQMEAYAILS